MMHHLLSTLTPFLLKSAKSELVLPKKTKLDKGDLWGRSENDKYYI